jgi:hypothetical protein
MIGKSVQEGGQDMMTPHHVQSQRELPSIDNRDVIPPSAVDKTAEEQIADEVGTPVSSEVVPETDQMTADEIAVKSKAEDALYDSEMEMHAPEGGVSEDAGAGEVTVTLSEEPAPVEMASPTEIARQRKKPSIETALDIPEQVAAPKVEQEEPSVSLLADYQAGAKAEPQSAAHAFRAAGRAVPGQDDSIVWRYDNWNLNDLRGELKMLEAVLGDSLFKSDEFLDYTGMKSSVAIMTRDSVDIYDAVNTIDTLLKYNPQADPRFWKQRQYQLESIIPIPPGP